MVTVSDWTRWTMLGAVVLAVGCTGSADQVADGSDEVDVTVCAPDRGGFSLQIDNPYLPLLPGMRLVYQGTEDSAVIDLEITVLDETEVVAGVTTRVVQEREEEDGELVEISRNFFVQASDGAVCYYGEEVDIYEAGQVVSHEGAWRAGEAGAQPGILMPAQPTPGMRYPQEIAPGVAEDEAVIISVGDPFTVAAGTFDDTVATEETTPLEPGSISRKRYARGVGQIFDEPVELISHEPN